MADPFSSHNPKLDSPAGQHFAITPSDSADLATHVNAAGTLAPQFAQNASNGTASTVLLAHSSTYRKPTDGRCPA